MDKKVINIKSQSRSKHTDIVLKFADDFSIDNNEVWLANREARALYEKLSEVFGGDNKKSDTNKRLKLASICIGQIRDVANKETDEIINEYFEKLDNI